MSDDLKLAIDHIKLSVEDVSASRDFYANALAPLALEIVGEVDAETSGNVHNIEAVCFEPE